jgi:UDP-N-acetylglucosamine 2-epimerase (non-hydrolysing)
MKILHVVGARPNFPKLAPVYRAARAASIDQVIVHTGQHYDDAMSESFFAALEMPRPHVDLAVGSASHAVQTGRIMERIEPVLCAEAPTWVVVYGDVNSTVAAALVASKLGIRIAHVEAGLRSGDRSMPEEINRIVTDRLADLLLTPSRDAGAILRAEGEPDDEIVFVGNVMIDTLFHTLPTARQSGARARWGVDARTVVVTLHRPSNVESPERLAAICAALRRVAESRPVLFPAHPRTKQRLDAGDYDLDGVRLCPPLSYPEMVDILHGAFAAVTDSGGIQEETTALGVPCFTIRENTERPITVSEGTNRLVRHLAELPSLLSVATRTDPPRLPEGWDGRAAERVASALLSRTTVR